MDIAMELGIKYPTDPKSGEPIVMTSDFLITLSYKNEYIELVRTVKPKDDLMNKRIFEKFAIERVYWQRKELDWGIVTEQEIDKIMAHNISFLHGYKDIENIDSFSGISHLEIKELIYEFLRRIIDNERSMRSICFEFDSDMHLEKGSGLSIFKYLVINKIIDINIKDKIDVNKNIIVKTVRETKLKR